MARLPGDFEKSSCCRLALLLAGMSVVWILCLGASVGSAGQESVENKIKVAFLLNFAKFTSWPPETFPTREQPFLFCVGGENPFGALLQDVEQKQVGGRSVHIVRLSGISKVIDQCQLLYLSPSEERNVQRYLQLMGRKPILTVSEHPGFAESGGIIELRKQDDRLAFIVNNQAARKVGLRLSSALLHLAQQVL